MKLQKRYLIIAMATAMGVSGNAIAADEATTQMHFDTPQSLSNDQSPDLGMAFKAKLVRLGNGMLISAFGDGVDASKVVYDLKSDEERPARDIFVRTCASATVDCGSEANWSAPVNVSNTVTQTSISTDWDGESVDGTTRKPYWGDSDKPNIANGGGNLMLTWVDKYCDGGNQRTVTYVTRDNREIPFSCTYASYSSNGGLAWSAPVQLSDGSRDAKQDASKVNSMGKSVITWQEDPLGLQIGSADGPGDGASGATASHGTDVWYTTTTFEATKWEDEAHTIPIAGKPTGFATGARLTDNATTTLSGDNRTVKDIAGNLVAADQIDGGQTAATRANNALVGSTVVVTYEETKGSEEIEYGKYIRYHSFPYSTNPSAVTNQAGCVISNPEENARRVRFVPQATPGSSGLQMGIFWKEGKYDQGGPSDIMVRLLKNGVAYTNMVPAVAANCETSDYAVSSTLVNAQAINISSNTETGGNLSDTTEANNAENALAHRGAIVGDDLYIGYSYTNDWALATYTNLRNYDFWLRHYDGVTDTWTPPRNLSNLPSDVNGDGVTIKPLSVREPRFVKTPYSAVAEDNYNPDAFVVAWGTQTNVASHLEDPVDQDIYYTRSFDKGVTYEPVVRVDNPNNLSRFESQLRPTPDGQTVYAVWNEQSVSGVDAILAKAISGEVTGEFPYIPPYIPPTPTTGDTTVASSGGSASLFGGMLMPALIGLFMGLIGFFGLRKIQK
ncbi:hypothetical protein THMIRHAM_19280 [Thiomicrorhabdus immobilis]|uniref:Exo-alpha-sialidase n=1 Tax=Thiomicrorhabdus immobilis TaxID=2791037 RepID=A0ABN6CYW4_9GAMM|nr:choice-of-anchor O protein [Thiomicrorhabdus immobilis]BCN94143.1 hypothetical protein THMIRHAM_19280 [Thiomicrorhabdus immobilis]